jgi:hypothetical protein
MRNRVAVAWMLAILGAAAMLLWWLFGNDSAGPAPPDPSASVAATAAVQSAVGLSTLSAAANSGVGSSGAPLSPEGIKAREEKLAL